MNAMIYFSTGQYQLREKIYEFQYSMFKKQVKMAVMSVPKLGGLNFVQKL
jgi:hypothetical protein